YAVVFQWRARSDFSDRAFENRAVVRERLAVIRPIQWTARLRNADFVATKWVAIHFGQPVHAGRSSAEQAGPGAVPQRRQHRGEVLGSSGQPHQQDGLLSHW